MNTSSRIGAGVAVAAACAALLLACLRPAQGALRAAPGDNPTPHHDAAYQSERSGLSGVLREYDRQIAALRATLHPAAFADNTAQISRSIANLRAQIASSAADVNAALANKAVDLAARQDAAVSAALASAGSTAPSRAAVAQRLQHDYQAEYAQLRNGAGNDMNAYRRALLSQERTAYANFVNDVNTRTQQAYFNRAQELREKESALLLELAKADAPQRLLLRAKLQTLALNGNARAQIEAQLSRIQARENAAISPARARDAAVLERYRTLLVSKANTDVAQMSVQLQSRTQANLAARRDVFVAQRAQPAGLPISAESRAENSSAVDLRARVAALRSHGAEDFRSQAQGTIAAYQAARDDIANRYGSLRDTDSASLQSTIAAIAQLERDRAALARRLARY